MAGIARVQRDLADTRAQLEAWFGHQFGGTAPVSELHAANRAAGWSSESLVFSAESHGRSNEYVLRILPKGGGIFPDYDLAAQTRTQELLHRHGIATPSPIRYEPDESWIGSKFLVMPRIVGHTPSDTTSYDAGVVARCGTVSAASRPRFFSWRRLPLFNAFRSTRRTGSNGPWAQAFPLSWLGGMSTWPGAPTITFRT